MADFCVAFNLTEKNEGKNIWTKITGDNGGETWSGISRKANPTWDGWNIIDQIQSKKNGQKISTDALEASKQQLYRTKYWDTIWGNKIKNQKVANDLYDTSVNMGPNTSIRLMERQFKLKETGRMSEELLNKLNQVV